MQIKLRPPMPHNNIHHTAPAPEVRTIRYVTWIGFWINAILMVLKIAFGIYGHSDALVGRIVQRALKPLGRGGKGRIERINDHTAMRLLPTVSTHSATSPQIS